MSGVLIKQCTKSMVLEMRKLRKKGYPYKTIAAKIGFCTHTIARYDRVFERYGIEAFADD